ncbi:hypothetical protein [Leptospira mayottensis]|uniref:hypothetical protein n=1 Tax=Leptospira mayottensis TaxID=1137606 RepID=UPI000E357FB9|nr:hypothetical protein [Leptospira mayottensis]AXR69525.1 hypothetical protein DPV73_17385 [Leptospira mayottensis]
MNPNLIKDNKLKYPQGEERERIFIAFEEFMNVFRNEFQLSKPFDPNAQRISTVSENFKTISDIVKEKKKSPPISFLDEK